MISEATIYYGGDLEICVVYTSHTDGIELHSAMITDPSVPYLSVDLKNKETYDTILSELEETLEHLTQPY
jgi:hypothetical protein